jgi:opacity protein-like surface antigen
VSRRIVALLLMLATPAFADSPPKRSAISSYMPTELEYKAQNFQLGIMGAYGWASMIEDKCEGCAASSQDMAFGIYGNWMQRPNDKMTYGLEVDAMKLWTESTDSEWLASLRARVGVYVAPNIMTFVTGGAAWEMQQNNFGWVASAGVEVSLTKNLSTKLEYLHYEMEDRICEIKRLDMVRMGLSYNF